MDGAYEDGLPPALIHREGAATSAIHPHAIVSPAPAPPFPALCQGTDFLKPDRDVSRADGTEAVGVINAGAFDHAFGVATSSWDVMQWVTTPSFADLVLALPPANGVRALPGLCHGREVVCSALFAPPTRVASSGAINRAPTRETAPTPAVNPDVPIFHAPGVPPDAGGLRQLPVEYGVVPADMAACKASVDTPATEALGAHWRRRRKGNGAYDKQAQDA